MRFEITGLAYGGAGVGRVEGKVVFVPFTAPGDVVEAETTAEKKGYSEGRLTRVVEPSPLRVEPRCPLFTRCGGCSFQHIAYGSEVEWKQRMLADALKRIGRIEGVAFRPPAPAPSDYSYRSRARFHFTGGKLGFFEAASRRVVDVEECPLLDPLLAGTYRALRAALLDLENTRLARSIFSVEVGLGPADGRTAALFHLSGLSRAEARGAMQGLGQSLDGLGGLKGFEARLHDRREVGGPGAHLFTRGEVRLGYRVDGMLLEAGLGSFTQTNMAQNAALVARTVELAAPSTLTRVADLHAGVGNLTLPLAKRSCAAVGVEFNAEAAADGEANARANGVGNAEFTAMKAAVWLKGRAEWLEKGNGSVVILDPPRSGDAEAAAAAARSKAARIVYVSCSPPTLARDLAVLSRAGYGLFSAALVDMFPRTHHIEAVVAAELLDKPL